MTNYEIVAKSILQSLGYTSEEDLLELMPMMTLHVKEKSLAEKAVDRAFEKYNERANEIEMARINKEIDMTIKNIGNLDTKDVNPTTLALAEQVIKAKGVK